jgi:phytoene synthase
VSLSIEQAYAACKTIARREAKNFYYSFLVLPKQKRLAMYAMYAFMRHADDLADDETLPVAERRTKAKAWIAEWRRASAGAQTENPVFIAVRDVQKQFKIPSELLDQLIHGTMMDLMPQSGESQQASAGVADAQNVSSGSVYQVYKSFDDLYQYCYYVASVVGLVCIRIFGYTDKRAEKLAEETGIAFQLTNILRDVREDAERGRIYIPLEDLRRYDVRVEHLASMRSNELMTLNAKLLLEMEAQRAEKFYASADALLPMIDADSRPALWVLVSVYRRLLHKIMERQYQVFSKRVKVPAHEKIAILLCGIWKMARARWI